VLVGRRAALAAFFLTQYARIRAARDLPRHFSDPARRAWFTGRLRSWLDELGAEWKCIEGEDWAERTAAANVHLDTFS